MKTCYNCGAKNFETSKTCSRCNQPIYEKNSHFQYSNVPSIHHIQKDGTILTESGLSTAVKVSMLCITISLAIAFITFLILWIIALALPNAQVEALLLLIYMLSFFIPTLIALCMTISYFNKINAHEPIGIGFKICAIIFVGILPGVLMLCDGGNGYKTIHVQPQQNPTPPQENKSIPITTLKEYKELLDAGIITQEEFDAKKKQILDL